MAKWAISPQSHFCTDTISSLMNDRTLTLQLKQKIIQNTFFYPFKFPYQIRSKKKFQYDYLPVPISIVCPAGVEIILLNVIACKRLVGLSAVSPQWVRHFRDFRHIWTKTHLKIEHFLLNFTAYYWSLMGIKSMSICGNQMIKNSVTHIEHGRWDRRRNDHLVSLADLWLLM